MANTSEFQVSGKNNVALFTLKVHRGDGMALLAMNWKVGTPPNEFVGFAIEYKEPGGQKFYSLKNRIGFLDSNNKVDPNKLSSLQSPFQKFRWVHFPRNADLKGKFTYRVTPVFMNDIGELSYGEVQKAEIELQRETYQNQINVTFTRGFISSQAFVDFYEKQGPISTLLPEKADDGLIFVPTHPMANQALDWMGFEARKEILSLLDKAILDQEAQVRVVAYDLSESEIVKKFEELGNRLKIIIDDSPSHKKLGSGENQSETILMASAGANNVKRQHMGTLQHNKMIVVESPNTNGVVFGSTNYSWRGFFVQANNAVIVSNKNSVKIAMNAFENYWNKEDVASFGESNSAIWQDLQLDDIDAKVAFSPHSADNAILDSIANDISNKTTSSLFYSLAFLYQTPGVILNSINKVTNDPNIFVYGMSDRKVGGIIITKPNGNKPPLSPSQLEGKSLPEPFKTESSGGGGVRLHHKFVVIDFDKPTARVYLGSYNFSKAADNSNGENLLLIKDRKIAVSYMIEGLSLFDHYHFRVNQIEAKKAHTTISLKKPPKVGEIAW